MIIAITRCGLLTLIFLLSGCGDGTQRDTPELSRYYYSNITGDDLFFTVNGKSYHLAHDSEGITYLPSGLNKLETPQGQQISFLAYPGNSGGILNPSRARYYSYTIHDGDTLYSPQFNSLIKTFKFDGHYYQGPLQTSNAEIIDNNMFKCRYFSDIPDIKAVLDKFVAGEKGMVTVCMNEKEFRRFLEYNPRGVSSLPDDTVIRPEQDADINNHIRLRDIQFQDPELRQAAAEITGIMAEFQNQTDVTRKYEIYSRYHRVLMRMANYYRQLLLHSDKENKTDKEESRKFSDFIQETGEIFGAGVLLLKADDASPAP
ncbi:hypothetical protein [Morganella morganii]|uniref:hypothetical protein n=1 Tax=Morganella morganii TaxID=582 RepID=UPI00141A150D|nr:hypothetical protein [Morganella morganii]NIH18963.1 hypothetical protein [Morganella morganii]